MVNEYDGCTTYEVFIPYIETCYSTNFKKLQRPSSMLGMHRDHGENRLDSFCLLRC
jgi:hypothetical protein